MTTSCRAVSFIFAWIVTTSLPLGERHSYTQATCSCFSPGVRWNGKNKGLDCQQLDMVCVPGLGCIWFWCFHCQAGARWTQEIKEAPACDSDFFTSRLYLCMNFIFSITVFRLAFKSLILDEHESLAGSCRAVLDLHQCFISFPCIGKPLIAFKLLFLSQDHRPISTCWFIVYFITECVIMSIKYHKHRIG